MSMFGTGFRRHRASAEANRRRNRLETYTEPVHVEGEEALAEFRQFLAEFYHKIYTHQKEMRALQEEYPETIGRYFGELVPSKVTYEDFWQRCYWKCDEQHILNEWDRKDRQARDARAEFLAGRLAQVQHMFEHAAPENSQQKMTEMQRDEIQSEDDGNDEEVEEEEAVTFREETISEIETQVARSPPRISESLFGEDIIEQHASSSKKDSREVKSRKTEVTEAKQLPVTALSPLSLPVAAVSPATPSSWPHLQEGTSPTPPSASVLREWQHTEVHADDTENNDCLKQLIEEKEKELSQLVDESTEDDTSRVLVPVVPGQEETEPPKTAGSWRRVSTILVVVTAVLVAWWLSSSLLVNLLDGLCAPVRPGTELTTEETIADAPWWAPAIVKPAAFSVLCGNRTRTRLVWRSQKNRKQYELSILSLDDENEQAVEQRRLSSAKIESLLIAVYDRRDNKVQLATPWALH